MSSTVVTRNKEKVFDAQWLRAFKGFETYSEKEAIETIQQLEQMATTVCVHLSNTS
jgi:hypothetical protein